MKEFLWAIAEVLIWLWVLYKTIRLQYWLQTGSELMTFFGINIADKLADWAVPIIIGVAISLWRVNKHFKKTLDESLGVSKRTLREDIQKQRVDSLSEFIGTKMTDDEKRVTVHGRFNEAESRENCMLQNLNDLLRQINDMKNAKKKAGELGENISGIIAILQKTVEEHAQTTLRLEKAEQTIITLKDQNEKLTKETARLTSENERLYSVIEDKNQTIQYLGDELEDSEDLER